MYTQDIQIPVPVLKNQSSDLPSALENEQSEDLLDLKQKKCEGNNKLKLTIN